MVMFVFHALRYNVSYFRNNYSMLNVSNQIQTESIAKAFEMGFEPMNVNCMIQKCYPEGRHINHKSKN